MALSLLFSVLSATLPATARTSPTGDRDGARPPLRRSRNPCVVPAPSGSTEIPRHAHEVHPHACDAPDLARVPAHRIVGREPTRARDVEEGATRPVHRV